MPQRLIPAIINAVIGYISGGPAGAAYAFFATLIISTVFSGPTSKRRGVDYDSRGRNITVRQPLAPWQIAFGEARMGGVLTYAYNVNEPGNNSFHLVVTFTGHESHSIGDIYFDDAVLPLDATGYGALAGATGHFAGYVGIQKSNGDEGSVQPFPDLVIETGVGSPPVPDWTSTHRQQGRTKIWCKLLDNPELFPVGIPNITAIIKGLEVYDPRTAATAWHHNPALIINRYLTDTAFGLGADYATEVDEDSLIAAANICEERVLLAGDTTTFTADATTNALTLASGSRIPCTGDGVRLYGPGSPQSDGLPGGLASNTTYYAIRYDGGTIQLASSYANAIAGTAIDLTTAGSGTLTLTYYDEPRYTANGAFNVDQDPQKILEKLLACMVGKLTNVGGKWFIFAGAYEAPTITLDEDDLAGPIVVRPMMSRAENCNGVKGVFVDPSNAWQPTDFPPVDSSTYLAEDSNERVWRDIDLTCGITSPSMAQRIAKIELLRARQALTVEAPFKLSAYRAMTGRSIALTNSRFGWTAKAFDVLGSSFNQNADGTLGVRLQLRETAEAVYDWSASEEQAVDIAPNTNLPDPFTQDPPTALAFTQSTTVWDTAVLTWTAPSNSAGIIYQVEYKLADDSTYTVHGRVTGTTATIPKLRARVYDFQVKAINSLGVASAYAQADGNIDGPTIMPFGEATGLGYVRKINNIAVVPLDLGLCWVPTINAVVFPKGGISTTLYLINPINDESMGEIDAGQQSSYVSFCPGNNRVYATPFSGTTVKVVDPVTRAVESSFDPGVRLGRGVYCPKNGRMYFRGTGTVKVVSVTGSPQNDVVASISLGGAGHGQGITYCPTSGLVYAVNGASDQVSVINPDTDTELTTITVGDNPFGICYCPEDDRLYVTNINSSTISVINPHTNTVELTIRQGAYLLLTGNNGGYASTPDAAQLDIIGPIDLRAYVAMDDWTPAAVSNVLAKWTSTGNQRSYRLSITATGLIRLSTSTDGTAGAIQNNDSSVAPTVSNGAGLWIRATLAPLDAAGNRVARFYTSNDPVDTPWDQVNWDKLGTTVTTAGTGAAFASTAVLEVGSQDLGTSTFLAGKVYRAQVFDGIDGDRVADFDARRISGGTGTGETGETWTINNIGSPLVATIVQDGAINGPREIVYSTQTRLVYYVDFDDDQIVAIQPSTHRILASSDVTAAPVSLIWVPSVSKLYAANGSTGLDSIGA